MQKAKIYYNNDLAGILSYDNKEFTFKYDKDYLLNNLKPMISLNLPKRVQPYKSKILFPFFAGLLSEGYTKELQCKKLRIDENDLFTRLLKTAHTETIGAITVREVKE